MHAWYFTFEFPPDFGGGLSSYMRVVTDAYAARPESSLVIFTLSRSQSGLVARRYLHDNVQLVTINPNRSHEYEDIGYWVNVSRLFERFADLFMTQIHTGALDLAQPDYVEFADGFAIGALTIQQKLCLNSRLHDVPILITAHTPTYLIDRFNQIPTYRLPNYWTAQLELQALCGADLVIGCSQAILDIIDDELGRTGAQLRRSTVLHNPFPPPKVGLAVASAHHDHFYMASRLTHWKGVESAIKAFEILWKEGVEVPFHIYGDDTYFTVTDTDYSTYIEKRYKKYIEQGLLKIMGKRPRREIAESARTAYAQVHPSHFDNFPYSLLEAMSEGTVCVAGLNGGIRELARDGKDMFLTDVLDAAAFATALRKAMALSDEERAQMGQNARERVRQGCDPAAFFQKKEALVAKIAARKPAHPTAFPFLSPPTSDCIMPTASDAIKSSKTDLDGARPGQASPSVSRIIDAPRNMIQTLRARRRSESSRLGSGSNVETVPELSIVVPYFNMDAFIDDTIDSITKSTFSNYEIILIDDGSTSPNAQEKLTTLHAAHGLTDEKLRILSIPNGGVANARNTGVRQSRAPFVSLLDADDLVGSRYYEKAIRILKAYENVSFCGAWIEDYNVHGRIRNWATWNAEPPIQLIMNQTNCQSLVYKRMAFERDGWHDPDLRMFLDDWEGVISMLAGGHRGVMIPEALFEYRIRADSIFRSTGGLWEINYEKITQKHRNLYDEWGADIAAFMNANGPNNFYHIAGKESNLRK